MNALSVDVEEYFQVSAFENFLPREDWENLPSRIEQNVDRLLELFNDRNVKATFFVLGWIAERHPLLIRKMHEHGHEIASHGYSHTRIIHQSQDNFRQDVSITKKILEDIIGDRIRGYRAASFSINEEKHWAHEILEEEGHAYSSSVNPIRHDIYGIPDGARFPYLTGHGNLLEIPITTCKLLDYTLPCGGGGYFRLLPYPLYRYLLNKILKDENCRLIFYFHPWEIDNEQPRMENLNLKTRFRHYTNLGSMFSKLESLLTDFEWDRVDRVFSDEIAVKPD